MATTYSASAAGGGTTGTSDRTLTFTPAVGDGVVVIVALSGCVNPVPSMTDDKGGTYYLAGTALWGSSANILAVFCREQIITSATSTVITCASGSNTAGELVALRLAGPTRVGAGMIRSIGWQANQAGGGTPAPTLNQSALTGNLTIVAVASSTTAVTPPTNWTERQDVNQATPTTALEVATRDSGFTGTTITYGASVATAFASVAIEIDSSSDAAGAAYGAAAVGTFPVVVAAGIRQMVYHDPLNTQSHGYLTTWGTDVTFATTDVNTTTDEITASAHGMITCDGPFTLTTSNTLPAGLTAGTRYWVRRTASNLFQLATSAQNAKAGTVVNITSTGTGTHTLVRAKSVQPGDIVLVGAALGTWANSPEAPTVSTGDTLTALAGSPIGYSGFPASKAGWWWGTITKPSSAFTASKKWACETPPNVTDSDEPTIVFIVIRNATTVLAATQSESANGSASITSNAVTAPGPGLLIASIWGGGPVGQSHNFTWNGGFARIEESSATADTSSNGYIQHDSASLAVTQPGSYTFNASGVSNEGGQKYEFWVGNPPLGAAGGTSSVTGAGAAIVAAAGSASGTGTAAAIAYQPASDGAAAGTSSVAGTGASVAAGAGASAGTSSATAAGAATAAGTGAAAGTSTPTGVGASTAAVAGAASGTSSVAGVSNVAGAADGAAAGTSTATATGASITAGVGAASGTSTPTAVGASVATATGDAAGTSAAAAAGARTAASAGAAAGTSSPAAVGASTAAASGAASGAGAATGVADGTGAAQGSADGASSAAGEGSAISAATGAAEGASTVGSAGAAVASGLGAGAGTSSAVAVGASVAAATGSAAGTSAATGLAQSAEPLPVHITITRSTAAQPSAARSTASRAQIDRTTSADAGAARTT